MSTGTQVDLDWAGVDAGQAGGNASPTTGAKGSGDGAGPYPSDEEILGIDPPSPNDGFGGRARENAGEARPEGAAESVGARHAVPLQATEQNAASPMPQWLQAMAGDPKLGPEAQRQAQQLWQEHQAFRAAFSSPDEARAIKELFPGGAQEARALREAARDIDSLRQAAQAVDQIDAAIYSGDARAQSEVVAELARANPAAFRSLFAEAAKVLAGMGSSAHHGVIPNEVRNPSEWLNGVTDQSKRDSSSPSAPRNDNAHRAGSPTGHSSQPLGANQSAVTSQQPPQFDPSAYAAFERSTNDAVARDVRAAVSDTLTRVLPEGVGEGAARRIGDDIFHEIHRTLAADRTLSEQVGDVLRGRQFGANEQQRVSQLLSGRARQLVTAVARRVIGEWTTSVLGTARNKSARQAAAASRVDIAAPGGSLDSMPLRPMSPREVNYASMSDDDILGM